MEYTIPEINNGVAKVAINTIPARYGEAAAHTSGTRTVCRRPRIGSARRRPIVTAHKRGLRTAHPRVDVDPATRLAQRAAPDPRAAAVMHNNGVTVVPVVPIPAPQRERAGRNTRPVAPPHTGAVPRIGIRARRPVVTANERCFGA